MLRFCFVIAVTLICADVVHAQDRPSPLPQWLHKVVEQQSSGRSFEAIWEVTLGGAWHRNYRDGKRAYYFSRGGETYDLFDEHGKWLCRRGGYSDAIRSGACAGVVSLVRVIFPTNTGSSVRSERTTEGSAPGAKPPLPVWLIKLIARHVAAHSGFIIEACTYGGRRVFEVSPGEVSYLLNEDGTQRCQFGGYSGHVIGACLPEQIRCTRELYPTDRDYSPEDLKARYSPNRSSWGLY